MPKLYPAPPRTPLEKATPAAYNPKCGVCSLGATCGGKPLAPERRNASGQTVLVVQGIATRGDIAEERPAMGRAGTQLRAALSKWWHGNIVLDTAVRCFPGKGGAVKKDHRNSCLRYLAQTLEETKPDRIILVGDDACESVLGRRVQTVISRRAYTWLWNEGKPIPVFIVLEPAKAMRNRFLKRFLFDDIKWASEATLPAPKHFDEVYSVVHDADTAAAAVKSMRAAPEGFAFDAEWAGFKYQPNFRLLCLAVAEVGRPNMWLWDEKALNKKSTWQPLREVLEDASVPKGGSNVKSDQHALATHDNVVVKGLEFDVRLRRKMLDAEASGRLEDMAELVGMGGHKEEMEGALGDAIDDIRKLQNRQAKATQQSGFGFAEEIDTEASQGFELSRYEGEPRAIAFAFVDDKPLVQRYCVRDARSTARLESLLSLQMNRVPELQATWEKLVLPAARTVQRIEQWGIPADRGAIELFIEHFAQREALALAKVRTYAPDINPASRDQVAHLLFDQLGLPILEETPTGLPKLDEETYAKLAHLHPLPAALSEFSHASKFRGYGEGWLKRMSPGGRIHGNIKLDGTRTGRGAMSEPNMQNLPRAADSADGKMARDCFVAPRGFVLVQLDYSQLELRIASLLSGDTVMADLFRSGVDFHLGTAKLISKLAWGIEPDKVGKPHRTGAKAFNFGLAYGKGDKSLAADLGISVEAAKLIRKAIFGSFVRYGEWMTEAVHFAQQFGGCWTKWEGENARWRPLWPIAFEGDDFSAYVSRAKNGSINTPIQGTSSDFCTMSLTRIVEAIDRGEIDAQVVLPIHDSIMLLCPEATWQQAALRAHDIMVDYPWATKHVPLEVDIEMGTHWGSLVGVELADVQRQVVARA